MMEVVPMDYYPLIDRSKMPQVDLAALPDLMVFLGVKGFTFDAGAIHPTLLRLHQEVDVAKAMAIPEAILKLPILLAKDRFVLDGDHRAYRHFINNTMVPFIQINADFAKSVKALLEFPKTFELK